MEQEEKNLLRYAGEETQRLCTPHRLTWWRWRTGKSRVPAAVLALLRILVAGELPQGGEPWAGWRFVRGRLIDPDGHWHTPETIRAWWWTAQRLQLGRADENQLAQQLPPNVVLLESARPAHRITAELNRRLDASS